MIVTDAIMRLLMRLEPAALCHSTGTGCTERISEVRGKRTNAASTT